MNESTPIWDTEFDDRWQRMHHDDGQDTPRPPLNPDCEQGKHRACAGDAWDEVDDELTDCSCECHLPRPVENVVESL